MRTELIAERRTDLAAHQPLLHPDGSRVK
eukprot:COSAG01_NODE_45687_length_407_cov_0.672078_1_plen_28_part_10